jgi:hypothetical protein
MSKARNLADLLEAGGDVKLASLDNAPAPTKSTIDALGIAATSVTGTQASDITANNAKVTNYNQTKADIEALGIAASSITGTLPAISAASLTNIPAANITGTLPAIDGSALTNLPSPTVYSTDVVGGLVLLNTPTVDDQELKALAEGSFYVLGGSAPLGSPEGSILSSSVSGSDSVPVGMNRLWVTLSGGGGGGCTSSAFPTSYGSGGGGGLLRTQVAVQPGDTFSWTIGTGGLKGNPGASGTSSTFSLNGVLALVAEGGGGAVLNGPNAGTGASGTISTNTYTWGPLNSFLTGYCPPVVGGTGGLTAWVYSSYGGGPTANGSAGGISYGFGNYS